MENQVGDDRERDVNDDVRDAEPTTRPVPTRAEKPIPIASYSPEQ